MVSDDRQINANIVHINSMIEDMQSTLVDAQKENLDTENQLFYIDNAFDALPFLLEARVKSYIQKSASILGDMLQFYHESKAHNFWTHQSSGILDKIEKQHQFLISKRETVKHYIGQQEHFLCTAIEREECLLKTINDKLACRSQNYPIHYDNNIPSAVGITPMYQPQVLIESSCSPVEKSQDDHLNELSQNTNSSYDYVSTSDVYAIPNEQVLLYFNLRYPTICHRLFFLFFTLLVYIILYL